MHGPGIRFDARTVDPPRQPGLGADVDPPPSARTGEADLRVPAQRVPGHAGPLLREPAVERVAAPAVPVPPPAAAAPARLPRRVGGLWRNADFLRFWGGQSSAVLGQQVSILALPLAAILLLHASAFQVGLLTSLQTLPFLLVGLPAGVWLERVRRRPVLVASALGRAAALGTVPVAFVLHQMTLPYLDAVAFAMGLLTTFFDIAWQTYLPGLVGTPRLHEANARMMTSSSGARLVGPGLAGLLISAVSAPVALVADSLGFLATAGCLARIRHREPLPADRIRPAGPGGPAGTRGSEPSMRSRPADGSAVRVWSRVAEGLRYVIGHRLLRWTATATGSFNAVAMALNVVLVLYEARVLHLSAGTIGLVFMLGNVGFLLGALLVRPVTARLGIGPTIVASAACMAAAPAVLPLARPGHAVPVLVAGWFLLALGSPVFNANQTSLRLAITPEPLLARMTATMKFFVMGAMPIGSLAGGALGSSLGLRPTLWVVAVFSAVPLLAVALTDVRGLHTPPDQLHPPRPAAAGR